MKVFTRMHGYGHGRIIAFAAEPIDNSVRKYEIAVNDFTALKVVEGVTVEYRASADSAGFARFTTTPEMASC